MKKILLLVLCCFAMYTTTFAQDECSGPLTVTIEGASSEAPLDAVEDGIVQPTCGPDGSIAISVTGGSPDYTFQWQQDGVDFSTDQNLSNAGTGSYTVVITDDSGCSMELGPFELTEPDGMVLTGTPTDASCNMEGTPFDGSIDLEVTGGTADYTYSWTSDAGTDVISTDQDLSGLAGGEYTVVVTDGNGCTATETFTITAPEVFDVAWTSENPSCHDSNGDPDGSIVLNVTGGTGNYTYAWTTDDGAGLVADAGDQTGLSAGTYTLTVVDENGCEIVKDVTLEGPTEIVVALSKIDPTCSAENGTSDGSIDITVSGGSGDYTYAWTSDGGTGLDEDGTNQSGLGNGVYTVVVTDVNGCSSTEEITLEGPDAITVDAEILDPTCFGAEDGSITLNDVTGGAGGYSYNWNTVGGSGLNTTAQSQSDLDAGTYMLTITDDAGCSATFEWELNGPTEIVVTVDDQQDPDCHPSQGPENGTITISASGGAGDLTYAWSSDNAATLVDNEATQTNLPGGTYTVVVTDSNGCSTTEEITLIEAGEIDLESTVVPPTCSGANGSIWIAISPEGDTDEYTYVWSTTDGDGITQGEKHQTALTPGTYELTVTNQNGCSVSDSYVVPDVSEIEASGEITSAILCNGDESAELTVTASGGTGTLEYSIDEGDTYQASNVFDGLSAGDYVITVKDENGCTTDFDITVEEPEALTAGTCTEAQDLCNANEGEIKVQVAGGVGPYVITWSSTNGGTLDQETGEVDNSGDSFTFTGAQGGKSYSFVITDANGCQIP